MRDELTAILEEAGGWFVAYCLEVPEANGQGRTKAEAMVSLVDAIKLVLEDRRADAGPSNGAGGPRPRAAC